MLTEIAPKPDNPQAPPASEADSSYSQGHSDVVIYEDVAEKNPNTVADQKYTLTKCPAYESHHTMSKEHGQRITAM